MIINVKVKPRASEEKIVREEDGSYYIWVKEKTEGNKANRRVINLLAKEFGVHFSSVKIKNLKSRNKIVEIDENSFK